MPWGDFLLEIHILDHDIPSTALLKTKTKILGIIKLYNSNRVVLGRKTENEWLRQ